MLTLAEHAQAATLAVNLFGPASRLAQAHRQAVEAQVAKERLAYHALDDLRLAVLFADPDVSAFRQRAVAACYAAVVEFPTEGA